MKRRRGNIACHKSEARFGTLLREGRLASRAFRDEAFWRSQVNFGPPNPATDEKALWYGVKGSVYVVTLPAFQAPHTPQDYSGEAAPTLIDSGALLLQSLLIDNQEKKRRSTYSTTAFRRSNKEKNFSVRREAECSVIEAEDKEKGSLLDAVQLADTLGTAGVRSPQVERIMRPFKFLRSLPASWSQVSLIMRTKPGVDTLSFDDLYNNLRVFESDIKGSTASSSSTQNVAFVSSESTNSTNDVSTAYGVSTSSGHNSQKEGSSSYTDELKYSFFANQSSGPQLDHEDLEQVDEFDLEEMDLKWQVAMISMRLKKFYKKTRRRLQFDAKEPIGFVKTKEEPKALVTLDGEGVDWTGHAKDEQENFALTAYRNSGSDTEMSTRDKSGLGYGNQIHEGVLSYEKEVLESVFDSRLSDVENSPVYDRFVKVEGMHAVPPPMTGNYMPPKYDFRIDVKFYICVETLESVPEPVVVEPKVVSQPKVWSDAPIIKEYELDSDDEYVIEPSKEQEKPSFAFVNIVKHAKTPRETVKEQNTCSPTPKTTATANTTINGELELTASIDGQAKTITEASLRRHLKLEDNGVISTLPNIEIFEQLDLMGTPSTSPPPITETTPTAEEPTLMAHESHLQSVQSFGRDKGSLSLHELMVKKLEQTVKTSQARRRTRVELSDEEEVSKDPSKKGRSLIEELDLDAKISLVTPNDAEIQEKISDDTEVLLEEEETAELVEEPTELMEDQGSGEKREQDVTTADTVLNIASVPISTASATTKVSTAAANLVYIRSNAEKRKDKGKAIMIEDESVQKKSKKQLEQERLSHEEAIRLQEQIDEEERKRIGRDAKIAKQLLEEYDKAGKKEDEVNTAHVIDWNDPSVIRVGNYTEMYQVFENMLKNFDRDDLVKLWSLVQERYNSSGLTEDKEIELWVKLKMLFEPDAENLLEPQKYMHDPLKWWLYDICAVHHVSTEKGQDIFMLDEKDYPLTKGLATLMLCNKLRVDQQIKRLILAGKKLSTARKKLSTDSTKIESMKLEVIVEEIRIFKCWFHYHTTNGHQFTMSNRHQELASPEQMTSGKDFSNPLMADS
ncbi:hypothetical protein Tco_0486910 [Tanacetum coccineum]